jgi:hypothetical protein
MPENWTSFRVSIDGEWTAAEMAAEIEAVSYIHDFMYFSSLLYDSKLEPLGFRRYFFLAATNRISFREFPTLFPLPETGHMQVTEVQYGSPGFQDFLGIGKVVSELLSFVRDVIKIADDRKELEAELRMKRLEGDKKQQDIRAQELKNVRTLLKVLKDAGYSEAEIHLMVGQLLFKQDVLIGLAESEKIIQIDSKATRQAA